MSSIDHALLRVVLDAIIPPDIDPGATDLGVDDFIVALLANERAADEPTIRAGLEQLGDFLALDEAAQVARLAKVAAQPWFILLAELAAEGYYADPENGGNHGGLSWAMIGYDPRMPEPLLGKRH